MIDLDNFLDQIYTPLKDYSGVSQLVKDNQKIPPEKLNNNRIVYNIISFANTGSRQSIIRNNQTVSSDNPDFEYDIENKNIFYPEATLSLTGYGFAVNGAINQVREWFYINGLGDLWLRNSSFDCVIVEVMEIENRTTYLESDYEKRLGFDVILRFEDIVKVTKETIEEVEFKGETISMTLDL